MGVRIASARHLHVLVMAPALTDTQQSQQKFDLSPKTHKTDFSDCLSQSVKTFKKGDSEVVQNASKTETVKDLGNELEGQWLHCSPLHTSSSAGVMNNNIRMDDLEDKMGLEKARIDNISSLIAKDKNLSSDVEQILNNFEPDLCENDLDPVGDIPPPNVEEIMQVIKSMESNNTADSMFSLATDLTSNLSNFEKELLNDVDVMNISMDDQLIEGTASKENQTKEVIAELQKRQAKIERRVDFLLRRLRKIQAKHMGQHVSNEIAGVFEHANRMLRKAKETAVNNGRENQLQPVAESSNSLDMFTTITSATPPVEKLKPISQSSAKSLVRKLEASVAFQANAASRHKTTPRYFGSGSTEVVNFRSASSAASSATNASATALPPWSAEHKSDLKKVAGSLHAQMRLVQQAVDSDATASSSGGESCDEMHAYHNLHQQYLSIQKRASWRYATDRAAIAARWTWLQAQITDLEFRIRQYGDLEKLIRANKGPVLLEGVDNGNVSSTSPSAVNGYRGQLPGASALDSLKPDVSESEDGTSNADCQCARSRGLRSGFRKRKLVQLAGLHAVSKKAAKPSTIRCGCAPSNGIPLCALCTGRTDPTHPKDLTECLNKRERIALVDPAYHPVVSLPEDVSAGIHLEAIMKTSDWQMKSTKSNIKALKLSLKAIKTAAPAGEDDPLKKSENRRKYNKISKIKKIRGRKPGIHTSLARLKKKRLALAQFQSMTADTADEETEMLSNSAAMSLDGNGARDSLCSSPLLTMQAISGYSKQRNSRVSSYDIDNIVIPYSVAAATRVEKLQYKEILTPKWRLVDPDFAMKYTKTNGVVRDTSQDNSDVEDMSDEALTARHDKCEHEERKKFLSYLKFPLGQTARTRSHKRTDSRAESSGGNTPDPMSPYPGDHGGTTSDSVPLVPPAGTPPAVLSPPITPLPLPPPVSDESCSLPSIGVMRKRTISSQSTRSKDLNRMSIVEDEEEHQQKDVTVESEARPPYEMRTFPLSDEAYDKMLKQMPEDHRECGTNARSQDVRCLSTCNGEEDDEEDLDRKRIENEIQQIHGNSPAAAVMAGEDSESTESVIGDEDPNDPEWIDIERVRERYKR